MSYDLGLYPRAGAALRRKAVFDYLTGDHFTREGDDVHYSHPDTGSYFHFTRVKGGRRDSDDPNEGSRTHVYFNMNFYRPHTFGLEAAEVLGPFVERFDLTVDDPQSEGMGQGEYSREGFLRGWNAGNRFATSAFRELQGVQQVYTLPTDVNRRLWSWNYNRKDFGGALWEDERIDVYVPPVWYCVEGGQPRTFTLYPNLVPSALPRVDYVMLLRDELASPYKKKRKKTPAWVTWDEMRQAAANFEVRNEDEEEQDELDYLLLYSEDYLNMESPPKALAEWVIARPDWPAKPERITPDRVLDAELFAEAPAKGRKRK